MATGPGEELRSLEAAGFDALLAEHREAWARAVGGRRGDASRATPADELAARFASSTSSARPPTTGEAAVGARGLTGDAYAGHVFWDADVFVLPALAAIRPARPGPCSSTGSRRLPAARQAAAGRRAAPAPASRGSRPATAAT